MRPLPGAVLLFLLFSLSSSQVLADPKIELQNPGFEEGLSSWTASTQDNQISKSMAEAARNGQIGLRVEDRSAELGGSLFSSAMPVTPGMKYRLTFWARNLEGEGSGVYLIFFNSRNQYLNRQELGNENLVRVQKAESEWRSFSLEGIAPENAATVKVWIHSFLKSTGVTDMDDFTLIEVTE